MRAGAGGAAVGVDREHVGGAAEGADGYPATVLAETHVLDLGRRQDGFKSQGTEFGDGRTMRQRCAQEINSEITLQHFY